MSQFEDILNCSICRDFFKSPVILGCAHTFCSFCIRSHLAHELKCPSCRKDTKVIELRPNKAVEDIVFAWTDLKGTGAVKFKDTKTTDSFVQTDPMPQVHYNPYVTYPYPPTGPVHFNPYQNTHPQHGYQIHLNPNIPVHTQLQHTSIPYASNPNSASKRSVKKQNYAESSDDDFEKPKTKPIDDIPYVACPICDKPVLEKDINPHIDLNCTAFIYKAALNPKKTVKTPVAIEKKVVSTPNDTKPIPSLAFHLLKDAQIRSKLLALSLSAYGDRAMLIKRYTEYAKLYNANLDSSRPRDIECIKEDLRSLERSWNESREAKNDTGIVFDDPKHEKSDRDEFAKKRHVEKYKNNFEDLIQQVKRRRMNKNMDGNDTATAPLTEKTNENENGKYKENIFNGMIV